MGQIELQSERLLLRGIVASDAARIAELGGDWEVASQTSRMPYPYDAGLALQWIDGLETGELVWAICIDGELVGVCGFTPEPKDNSAEIGYWVGRPYWGRGIATEAARMLLKQCFLHEGFQTVHCAHFVGNHSSMRVIEKTGFEDPQPCNCWCEARQEVIPAVRYSQKRPRYVTWVRPFMRVIGGRQAA